jgi:hypothetical protein
MKTTKIVFAVAEILAGVLFLSVGGSDIQLGTGLILLSIGVNQFMK